MERSMEQQEVKMIDKYTGFFDFRTKIGLIIGKENDAILIDTGLDENIGRKILKVLEIRKYSLKYIVFTHSHADHYGGGAFLKKKTDAITLAPKIEASIIENPIIEALEFSKAAIPLKEVLNKFICGEACKVDRIIEWDGNVKLSDFDVKFIGLPGHSVNHFGVLADETFFIGDAVFQKDTLEKYKIAYLHDPLQTLESLKKIKNFKALTYLTYHGGTYSQNEINNLIDYNIESINSLLKLVFNNSDNANFYSIFEKALDTLQINLKDLTEYYLIYSTIRAYVNSLVNIGKIKAVLEGRIEKFYHKS